MLNECEQLWASRAAQALDARLTNHVVAPSVNPDLEEWPEYSDQRLTHFGNEISLYQILGEPTSGTFNFTRVLNFFTDLQLIDKL